MDSDMLASLILPTAKADPKTSVPILIANIRSQLRYTPSYRKAWIAKQEALEKMHSGWDASYNEVWQWCQVLERYVPGCIIDFEMTPAYTHQLLLAVAQDGSGRILPIAFAITLRTLEYYPQLSDREAYGIAHTIGYEISKDRFHEMLAVLCSVNEESANYLCNMPFEQWTQAYDGGL
ncbi:hypothetical protein J1N35_018908 [Gossypium stocksii]|uniref:Uncharacterized protein n=1 Tax=Gossypium stocksii TaxID=47602 RepID=A0A9D3VPT4_9ROSI|nr:hypothetical protein J1N35_018908 [Gossypium stocksii]